MKYALVVTNLSVAFQQTIALHDIEFSIPTGKLVAIIGPNGSGKTTLIRSIMGLITPTKGTIFIANQLKEGSSKKIAYISQRSCVDWNFPATSLDVVIMGSYGQLRFCQSPGKKERELALQALGQVGMMEYANTAIKELSGGQQQRLFIARALVQDAEIYLLDEPFVGVDATTETIVFNLFKQLTQRDKTIIVVHHDLLTVKRHFDTVMFINKTIIACGPTADVMTSYNIQKTFPHYIDTTSLVSSDFS